MTRTWNDGTVAVQAAETCPVCGSTTVTEFERDWFLLALDRSDEVRPETTEVDVEFACRACGSHWH
jgi:hypothetical protein